MVSLSEAASGHVAKTTPSRAGVAGTSVKSTKVSRAQASGGHAAETTASRAGLAGTIVGTSIGSRYVRAIEAAKAARPDTSVSPMAQTGAGRYNVPTVAEIQKEAGRVGLSPSEIQRRQSIQAGLRDLIQTGALIPEQPKDRYASFFYKTDKDGALIVPDTGTSGIGYEDTRPFQTKDQIEFNRKLEAFSNKVNANPNYTEEQKRRLIETFARTGSVSIYKQVVQSSKGSPKTVSESPEMFDKSVSELINLPTMGEIAKHREETLKTLGLTEEGEKIREVIESNIALNTFAAFSRGQYEELRTKPVSYLAELAALAAVGTGIGAGTTVFKKVTGAGVRAALGRKLAEKAVLGTTGRFIPIVGKIAIQDLPMVALDTYFVSEIAEAVIKGAKIDNKYLSELGVTSLAGGISTVIEAKKLDKDIQWVTERNLEIGKDLAVIAPFIGVGSGLASRIDVSTAIKTMKTIPTEIKGRVIVKRSDIIKTDYKPVTSKPSGERYNFIKYEDVVYRVPTSLKGDKLTTYLGKVADGKGIKATRGEVHYLETADLIKTKETTRPTTAGKPKPKDEQYFYIKYEGNVYKVPTSLEGNKLKIYTRMIEDGRGIKATKSEIEILKRKRIEITEYKRSPTKALRDFLKDESARVDFRRPTRPTRDRSIRDLENEITKVDTKIKELKSTDLKISDIVGTTGLYAMFRPAYINSIFKSDIVIKQMGNLPSEIKNIDLSKSEIAALYAIRQPIAEAIKQPAKQAVREPERVERVDRSKADIGEPFKMEMPILPMLELKKLKGVEEDFTNVDSFIRAYRIRKTTLGSIQSIFGGNSKTTKKKSTATKAKTRLQPARKTTKRRRKATA